MKISKLVFIFLGFVTIISCNQKTVKSADPMQIELDNEKMFPRGAYPVPIIEVVLDQEIEDRKEEVGEGYVRVSTTFTPEVIHSWHQGALNARNSLAKEENNKSYSMIDHGVWHYQMAFRGYMRNPKFVAGRWIKFLDNLTYEYGKYEARTGKGQYVYSPSKNVLILVDDNRDVKPAEFQIAQSGDDMVLHGTNTYEDQRLSAKFVKAMVLPTRPTEVEELKIIMNED